MLLAEQLREDRRKLLRVVREALRGDAVDQDRVAGQRLVRADLDAAKAASLAKTLGSSFAGVIVTATPASRLVIFDSVVREPVGCSFKNSSHEPKIRPITRIKYSFKYFIFNVLSIY